MACCPSQKGVGSIDTLQVLEGALTEKKLHIIPRGLHIMSKFTHRTSTDRREAAMAAMCARGEFLRHGHPYVGVTGLQWKWHWPKYHPRAMSRGPRGIAIRGKPDSGETLN